MYDPHSPWCNPCAPDTTPCDVTPSQTQSYTWHGLNGVVNTGLNVWDPGAYTQVYNFPNGKYYVGDALSILQTQKIPLFKAYMTQFPTIAQLLFNYDEILDPTNMQNAPLAALTFKSFPNIELIEPVDGTRYIRSEWKYEEEEIFIIQDEALPTNQVLIANKDGNPINLNAPGTNKLVEVNDTILIYRNDPTDGISDIDCCSTQIIRTITAIDTAVFNAQTYTRLTLEGNGNPGELPLVTYKGRNVAPNSINTFLNDPNQWYQGTYPGDKILKLFHSRNDCDPITNTFQLQGYNMKQSFIQHLGYKFSMNKNELNRSYDTKDGVMDYLRQKIWGANLNMVRSAARMFYMGRNRNPINQGNLPGETLGLIPALRNAHALRPQLRLIRSAAGLLTDEDRVRLILDVILACQNSGMVPRGSVTTMVMDNTAMAAFMKLNNAWNKFTGFMVTRTDNVTKDFTIPVIQTPNGKTEIMTCSEWTKITRNAGSILFIAKPLVGLRTRPNARLDLQSGTILKSTQGFNIEDVTLPGQHECRNYDVWTEMALIIGGIDSGAHAIIEGFRI